MKTCPKCGETKPLEDYGPNKGTKDGRRAYCRPCNLLKDREYKAANAEKIREQARARRHANPERHRETARKWREANPEKANEASRKWMAANPEKRREYEQAWKAANPEKFSEKQLRASRKWKAANPDKHHAKQREWREANLDKALLAAARRRARLRDASAFTVTKKDLARLKASPCAVCGSRDNIHLDHIIPLARGGSHSVGNLQALCAFHNQSKGAMLLVEWRYRLAS